MFRCVCGNKFIAQVYKVKTFETRSCGCAYINCYKKHGLKNHKLYGVWSSMKARCYNKNTAQYKDYGGRGVVVCEEWIDSFIVFYDWAIMNGWKEGMQLDKDLSGSKMYSPKTCIFITPKKNSNKRTSSRTIIYNGQSKTISEWADHFNISLKNLYQRLSRGWDFEKCISS